MTQIDILHGIAIIIIGINLLMIWIKLEGKDKK